MKRSRLRLLPVTMLVAFLALGLKIGEVMHDGHSLIISLANSAEAQQPAEPAKPADTAKPDAAKPDAAKPDAAAAPTDKKPDEAKKDDATKEGAPADTDAPALSDMDEKKSKREYSQVEVDLLQSLAQRRQELDNWSKQVQLKENMLIATEQRINEKIDNLQKMKKEIEDLLAQYNEQEDTKIRSLVKIYENMKPKDAARIFEELDMPVLLIVVDRMSERKVSPILAGMSPTKAKDLTVQLAEQRKLQKPRASAVAASAADAAAAADAAGNAATPAGGAAPATGDAAGSAATPPTDGSTPAASQPAAKQ